jgi:TDG/mug DNA glycosylase family protein
MPRASRRGATRRTRTASCRRWASGSPTWRTAGAAALDALVREHAPRLVAIVGVTAYRTAFGRPRADLGLQEDTVGGRPVWVLPNPSGLNAHHQLPDLARLYGEARAYAAEISKPPDGGTGTIRA